MAPADRRQLPDGILTEAWDHFHLSGAEYRFPGLRREGSEIARRNDHPFAILVAEGCQLRGLLAIGNQPHAGWCRLWGRERNLLGSPLFGADFGQGST